MIPYQYGLTSMIVILSFSIRPRLSLFTIKWIRHLLWMTEYINLGIQQTSNNGNAFNWNPKPTLCLPVNPLPHVKSKWFCWQTMWFIMWSGKSMDASISWSSELQLIMKYCVTLVIVLVLSACVRTVDMNRINELRLEMHMDSVLSILGMPNNERISRDSLYIHWAYATPGLFVFSDPLLITFDRQDSSIVEVFREEVLLKKGH